MKILQLSIFDILFGKSARPTRRRRPSRPSGTRVSRPRSSDLRLKQLWDQVAAAYFPERTDILSYTVTWSTRPQKRTLASCNLRQSRVVVARELDRSDCDQWLEPLLYHEMCHAILGLSIQRSGNRRQWHGAQFKALERQHPRIRDLDHWIKSGGWRHIVRSDRSRRSQAHRRAAGNM